LIVTTCAQWGLNSALRAPVSGQSEVVKQQINEKLVAADSKAELTSDKRKSRT